MKKAIYLVVAAALLLLTAEHMAGITLMLLLKQKPDLLDVAVFFAYVYWYHDNPAVVPYLEKAALISGAATLGPFVVLAFLHRKSRRKLHGSARFANTTEVKQAGLFADDGIVVGKWGGRYLRFPGQQFVMLAAPTRSGKGVGVVIPNLLTFSGSVVVIDIKRENFNLTSEYRRRSGQEVFLFDPFSDSGKTHCYNPLDYVRNDARYRVGDILEIANILFASSEVNGRRDENSFWYDAAQNLFLGLTLLVCETPEIPRTIGEVFRQASGYGKKLALHLNNMIEKRTALGRPFSPECVNALYRTLDNSEVTFAGIQSTLNTGLRIWADPLVDAATSKSDFHLTDVRKKPMSVYIGMGPDRLAQGACLMNLLFSQLIQENTQEMPQDNPELRHQCLLLMDEFTSVGKIGILATAVGFIASYNLRLLTIIQSISQLESVYGPSVSRTMATNHAMQILFAPREQKDANEYSEMLGYLTERNDSSSSPKGMFNFGASGGSTTTSDQRRALLLPQEVKEMGPEDELIVMEGRRPIRAQKNCYYRDKFYKNRLCGAVDVTAVDTDEHLADVEQTRLIVVELATPPEKRAATDTPGNVPASSGGAAAGQPAQTDPVSQGGVPQASAVPAPATGGEQGLATALPGTTPENGQQRATPLPGIAAVNGQQQVAGSPGPNADSDLSGSAEGMTAGARHDTWQGGNYTPSNKVIATFTRLDSPDNPAGATGEIFEKVK